MCLTACTRERRRGFRRRRLLLLLLLCSSNSSSVSNALLRRRLCRRVGSTRQPRRLKSKSPVNGRTRPGWSGTRATTRLSSSSSSSSLRLGTSRSASTSTSTNTITSVSILSTLTSTLTCLSTTTTLTTVIRSGRRRHWAFLTVAHAALAPASVARGPNTRTARALLSGTARRHSAGGPLAPATTLQRGSRPRRRSLSVYARERGTSFTLEAGVVAAVVVFVEAFSLYLTRICDFILLFFRQLQGGLLLFGWIGGVRVSVRKEGER